MEWKNILEGEMMELIQKRCAIYTRKSVEEGLEQEFNSMLKGIYVNPI